MQGPQPDVRGPHEDVLDRAVGHLTVDVADVRIRDGYVDLVGDRGPDSTGLAQDLMLTRLVPAIYERWWRPALARIAKGPFGPSMADERRIASELLELRPGDVAVDVACGPGNFTRAFAEQVGAEGLVIGVDISPTMLARAVQETDAAHVVYVRGDATEVPLRPGSVQAVCCFAALHLFPDPEGALGAMARGLAPGGRLALLTSYRPSGRVGDAVELGGRLSGMRTFTRDELVGELQRLGLEVTDHRTHGLLQVLGARRPDV